MTAVEKLAEIHIEYGGRTPERTFWGWLDTMSATAEEAELDELYNTIKLNPGLYFTTDELMNSGHEELCNLED
jgi:hypothetical protein